ncbi:LptF/LptG family permease [Rubinisphaera brasiliensis]|uniref:Permease YjgP/YjgQ family protein n=1 Tax=Rubinisphaera brasiliensis (strain ATCC 49424 / DSM 5305 / JCM 21570 / IAM 15109 / NBRC 103401 / IFAM 1448) TaxID=756272 RepID=F0SHV9_RUBBR|nr:LptF/LptG family permease [Rubinisphaera brasiliensis]ADY59589.1 permease YjgP/YjgQ family protein [Rubinisphaera brasiliensis DSM 5305]
MLTIFERSVFRQFLFVNAVFLCVIMGLFTIIDLFDNVDDFVNHSGEGGFPVIAMKIVGYYGKMGLFIFDAAAVPMIAISLLTTMLMLKRKGQIKPFLSAGIPAYRVLTPALLCGVCVMTGLKMANREILLGNAVHHLHATRGKSQSQHRVAPRYDHASHILIDGWAVYPEASRIEQAAFVLPPEIAGNDMICLKAAEAKFYPKQGKRPSGWLLRQSEPKIDSIPLTEAGRQYVIRSRQPENVFVVSDVSPDLIYKAKESSAFLSTRQLLLRIRSPAIDSNTARDLEFNLHARIVEPVLTGLMVWIAIPLILRKESRGMIIAAGNCGLWLFIVIASTYAVRFMASGSLVTPVQAAWLPLYLATPMAVWLVNLVET